MEYAADRNNALDPSRITGISVALVLNLAVIMLLWRGIDPGLPGQPDARAEPTLMWIAPPPKPIPPPEPPPVQVTHAQAKAEPLPPPPMPLPVEQAGPMDFVAPPPMPSLGLPDSRPASVGAANGTGAASGATLSYERAPPPPYPRAALQRGWQGTVWLLVSVDAQGRPSAVEIHQGSGHTLLDSTARQHVLKRWRFAPAMVNGEPIAARGLVPIDFRID